jgi:hypothetical protein
MQDDVMTPPLPRAVLPRHIPGEWHCLDCGRLSYGRTTTPRCPACLSVRLRPTLDAGALADEAVTTATG